MRDPMVPAPSTAALRSREGVPAFVEVPSRSATASMFSSSVLLAVYVSVAFECERGLRHFAQAVCRKASRQYPRILARDGAQLQRACRLVPGRHAMNSSRQNERRDLRVAGRNGAVLDAALDDG